MQQPKLILKVEAHAARLLKSTLSWSIVLDYSSTGICDRNSTSIALFDSSIAACDYYTLQRALCIWVSYSHYCAVYAVCGIHSLSFYRSMVVVRWLWFDCSHGFVCLNAHLRSSRYQSMPRSVRAAIVDSLTHCLDSTRWNRSDRPCWHHENPSCVEH